MKYLMALAFIMANNAFAGDLGMFSDGSKGTYRVYQTDEKVILRTGAKTVVYDNRLPGSTFYSYRDEQGITHNIDILDADSILLTADNNCSMLLTKKNSCL